MHSSSPIVRERYKSSASIDGPNREHIWKSWDRDGSRVDSHISYYGSSRNSGIGCKSCGEEFIIINIATIIPCSCNEESWKITDRIIGEHIKIKITLRVSLE